MDWKLRCREKWDREREEFALLCSLVCTGSIKTSHETGLM